MRFLLRIFLALPVLMMVGCSDKPTPYACPDWSDNPTENYSNKDMRNYGCAYNNNLRAQVVDPEDLDNGHGQQVESGERESTIIKPYMSNTPPNLPSSGISSSR